MSPNISLVGARTQLWDYELVWPRPAPEEALSLGVVDPTAHYWARNRDGVAVNDAARISASNIAVGGSGAVTYAAGIGGGVPGGVPFVGIDSPNVGDERGYGLEGARAIVETLPGGFPLPTGSNMASLHRVWWLKVLINYRAVAGIPTQGGGGLMIMPQNAAVNGWPGRPVGANNRGGWGITGDGAGNWQYISFDRTGVLLIREAIAFPAHNLTDWNQFECLIVSGRPGFNPYIEIWFNGTLVATRDWTGVLLERMGGVPVADANEWCFVPHIHSDDQGIYRFSQLHLRCGRYLRDGTEITGY